MSPSRYQNRAYISYQAIDVYNKCGSTIGKQQPGGLVELASTDVYSVWGNVGGANDYLGYPFNFADLSTPIPASAYLGQASCFHPHPPDQMTQASEYGARDLFNGIYYCLLYTSPSPRDGLLSRMPSSA